MKYLFFSIVLATSGSLFGQNTSLNGHVSESFTKGTVVGAKIALQNGSLEKAILTRTDIDGKFSFSQLKAGSYTATVTMLSFDTLQVVLEILEGQNNHDFIVGGSQELEEVQVVGNLAIDRKTPVAVTRISTQQLAEELGSRDLPMILNSTPGVHATQQGGGDGDARITIRGFDQRNVGVMIDGVPVNDMENGSVYWSNWFGLDAITGQIQVQRGLGATKLADRKSVV